jgi:hypothetical protein
MYNSKFVCTYSFYDSDLRKLYHNDENFDLEDVKEFENLSELVYQAELLQILLLSDSFNPDTNVAIEINNVIQIYNNIKSNIGFMECVDKALNCHLCKDLETAFIVLFSYDYFFLTHKCISEYLNTGKIGETNIKNLNNAIK